MGWEREILRPKETFELKTEEIIIKPSFGIFSKMTFWDLVENIQNLKMKTEFKMYYKYITN
jgi:hypothetical protein